MTDRVARKRFSLRRSANSSTSPMLTVGSSMAVTYATVPVEYYLWRLDSYCIVEPVIDPKHFMLIRGETLILPRTYETVSLELVKGPLKALKSSCGEPSVDSEVNFF